jgi:hypothetical protein
VTRAVGTPLRSLTATTILLAAAVAGCGGGDHVVAAAATTQHPTGPYLVRADLERQLGNAFRQGLYRLSVMSQRSDEATDLGQSLPTGLLSHVTCDSTAPQPGGAKVWMWGCDVRWRTVEGHTQRTSYTVRLTPGRCFSAGATPPRKPHYDATIRTYSVDPLNALGSLTPGC